MTSLLGRRTWGVPRRRRMLGTLAVLAVALVPAAIAWACNPQAYLQLNPTTVTPGDQMTVSGAFFKGGAQLTLSLEPGGQIATATTSGNGSFSTTVTAPSTVGSYTLSAIGYESDGSVTNGLPARASFSVGAAASQPPRPAPATPQPTGSQPGASQPGATSPSAGRFAEPEVPGTRAFSKDRGSRGGRERATSGGGGLAGAGAVVNTGAGVIDSSQGAVFAGSVARGDRSAVAATAPREARRGARSSNSAASTGRSAGGDDVWSGFESVDAPSLMPRASDATPGGGAGSQLTWGLGLLAVGLLTLVGGITAAEVRRRGTLSR